MSKEQTRVSIKLRMEEGHFAQAWRDISALDWDQYPQFSERTFSSLPEELSIQISLLLEEGVPSEVLNQFIKKELGSIKGIEYQGLVAIPPKNFR